MKFGLFLGLCLVLVATLRAQPELQKYRFEKAKMGTTFTLIFYDESIDHAQQVADAAFAKIDQLNLIFSDYESHSEVNLLSRSAGSGKRIVVSEELWEVLMASRLITKKSGGAFDISIGPLSKLWRRAFRQKVPPTPQQIAQAKSLVNARWIKLYKKSHAVSLKKKGMRLDLGGIAKGYTVDAVYKLLQSHGITSMMVDGGGDLMIGAYPDQGIPWDVRNANLEPISVTGKALASSGDTYRYLEWEGKKYSHIIDPRTGSGISQRPVVSILAPNCMTADALASTVSILQGKPAQRLLRKFQARALSTTSIAP